MATRLGIGMGNEVVRNFICTKIVRRSTWLFTGLLVLGLFWTPAAYSDGTYTHYHNDVEFHHYTHTEGQGIACNACHTKVKNGSYLMLGHDACIDCHAEQIDVYEFSQETCGSCHTNITMDGDQAVMTLRMNKPSNGIFIHTKALDNICYVCHGAMLDEIVEEGMIKTEGQMRRIREISHRFYFAESCENCHKEMSKELVPENHSKDWGKLHTTVAPTFNCRICHTKSFCKACHEDSY